MDILITYWNSVWRNAVHAAHNAPHGPTADEWAAYERSLKRDTVRQSSVGSTDLSSSSGTVVSLDSRRITVQ